jgi:16S rRNA A1518/A1519 N6-dimethyltransferase RsmA/KsgA/DIM1 with predicted DNA glycosylase/AP lyase activity
MLLILFVAISVTFALGVIFGAPYLPVLKREHDDLLDLCRLQPGQTLLDLGSGDGRFLKAAARRGYECIGYEINPLLYILSRIYTWPERKRVKIHLADYWRITLPQADAIYVFLIDRYMPKLDRKLTAEISKPTVVVSYIFAIPGRPPQSTSRNAFRYQY